MRIAMQTMLFPTLLLRGDAMLVVCGAHLSIRRRGSPLRGFLLFLKNLKKTIDRIYAIAYNNNCKGEMEIPQIKRGGHENEVQQEEYHEKCLEHPQVR